MRRLQYLWFGVMAMGGCTAGDARPDAGFGEDPDPTSTSGADEASSGSSSTSTGPGESSGGSDDGPSEAVEEAKVEFATYRDLHEKVIQRTCTPFDNVCHNNKEYPDLRTPQGMLDRIDAPCNLTNYFDEPEAVYNGCEPRGDFLRFEGGPNIGFASEIAYVETVTDPAGVTIAVNIHLREAIPQPMVGTVPESALVERATQAGVLSVGTLTGSLSYAAGDRFVVVGDWAMRTEAEKALVQAQMQLGDPNRDGIFGASSDDPMREIVPGDPWNSYLLQRLQGTVPGSPMPLANQPLSSAEIIALACWIETLAAPGGTAVESVIDYDGCGYAEEFGEPPEGAGASLSADVQPILDSRCAAPGCHGGDLPQAGLDLTAGVARDNLLQPSLQNPEVPRVTPGNPTNSYLVVKLTSAGTTGQQMPVGAEPLSEAEIDVIRTWIIQGAADN